jgi:pimeloyl-ACP methyl ester carboxylesterase
MHRFGKKVIKEGLRLPLMKNAGIATYNGQLVKFATKDKVRLHGFMFGNNHRRAIIHVHGLFGDFYRSGLTYALANEYAKRGYDLFSINTRGHDTVATVSKRIRKKEGRMTAGTTYEKFEDCAFDIGAAVDCVKRLGYREIILEGHSTGCQKIAYYQSKRQDRRVKALVLLAPADDLNLAKRRLGKKYRKAIAIAKRMIKERHGNGLVPAWAYYNLISARRFASFAVKGNAEADLFDYETGRFRLLRRIKPPILAVFGEKEKSKTKDVKKCLLMLKENAVSSRKTDIAIVEGANHSFDDRGKALALFVIRWLKELDKR